MHRFFIPQEWIGQNNVIITGEPLHQIGYVLRLRPGDHIIVLGNTGFEYEIEIERITKEQVTGKVISIQPGQNEPKVKITFYLALLRAPDKFELVLQKGVELGVAVFVPFISERCIPRKESPAKIERWGKIIKEAAEQSERIVLPKLNPIVSFEEACRTVGKPAILFWEAEKSVSIKKTLQSSLFKNAAELSIFIGPEGGFPDSEKELAEKQGIVIAGLGKRVLRAETAGLAAISAIMYEYGEMG